MGKKRQLMMILRIYSLRNSLGSVQEDAMRIRYEISGLARVSYRVDSYSAGVGDDEGRDLLGEGHSLPLATVIRSRSIGVVEGRGELLLLTTLPTQRDSGSVSGTVRPERRKSAHASPHFSEKESTDNESTVLSEGYLKKARSKRLDSGCVLKVHPRHKSDQNRRWHI